jgi:glycerol kinase
METEAGTRFAELKVDGGASANNFLMQFQADISGTPIVRPKLIETTALGAAALAGLGSGLWRDIGAVKACRDVDRSFTPAMSREKAAALCRGWAKAVRSVLTCSAGDRHE